MKRDERPIALEREFLLVPRWLRRACLGLAAASAGGAIVLLAFGSTWFADMPAERRNVAIATLIAGAIAMPCLLLAARWLGHRARAPGLFQYLVLTERTRLLRRAAVWLCPVLALFGAGALWWGNTRVAVVYGFVNCGLLAAMAGLEAIQRAFLHRQASVVFGLYADGVLAAADAAAIDDARAKDPQFDAAVREFQRVAALVDAAVRPTAP